MEQIVKADEMVQRLCSVPGIGPVTMIFVATLDDSSRFVGACAGRQNDRPAEGANREMKRTRCAVSVGIGFVSML